MQHYIISNTSRSARNISPKVVCVCGAEIPVSEAYRVRVPVGAGRVPFDPRPRTATGGRLGAPGQSKFRPFIRTESRHAGVCCALKYPIIESPRDAAFRERSKKR